LNYEERDFARAGAEAYHEELSAERDLKPLRFIPTYPRKIKSPRTLRSLP